MTHDTAQVLPLLPLRKGVFLPGTMMPIPVGRERSRALAADLQPGQQLVLGVQFNPEVMDPSLADMHPTGVIATLKEKSERGKTTVLLLEATRRVELRSLTRSSPYWKVRVEDLVESRGETEESIARAQSLASLLSELTDNEVAKELAHGATPPGLVADRIAAAIDLEADRKVEVLNTLDVQTRLELVSELLRQARARAAVRAKIDSDVRQGIHKNQREAVLRQQLQAIQKELGEGEDGEDSLSKLRERLLEAKLPEDVQKTVNRELRRLEGMQAGQAEAQVIRNHLELIADLPWSKRAETTRDIESISLTLDEDHYGLSDVKRRILEHMAVLKLSDRPRGTILALVGPPGVGKTSLAQSVSRATGRPLARVSLGGVRDEAEIRGHRRTYVGALPGRILSALRTAGVKNPVMVLDEIDKLGRGWAGDPEAALLEVLDPEQNATFTDHYLEQPFDLSEVLFIATANELSTLSPPLRDRLEIIDISGYTIDEKVAIGRDHLWPKTLDEHGLTAHEVVISDALLDTVVKDYTREAGVRQLSRQLAKLCRSVALDVAKKPDDSAALTIDEARVRKILGRPRFLSEGAERTSQPGVAAGLAFTPVGGDVLYIETTHMPGKGKVEITGQLGDVMSESARAALAYVRSHAEELGVDASFLETRDLHIHVPAGGIPKDGPSAGVTIFTALTSLLSDRRVRSDTAMTGEATLRGRVLPVGGIKTKVLAAHRAGFKRVILPKQNEADLEDIPENVRVDLEFIFADDMRQVLDAALDSTDLCPADDVPLAVNDAVHTAAAG